MRSGLAMLIVLGACAPAEEGVLLTIRAPEENEFDPVGKIELFLGGGRDPAAGDRRIRQVLDGLGGEDLRPIDGALDGYTILLQGIPADVRMVAVAAFHDDPLEPEDFPVALGTMPISFTPGELTSVDLTMRAVNGSLQRQSVRWRGASLDDPPVGHSCLEWTLFDGTVEQIVRADDYDCDGTLPIACSDMNQDDRNQPDDLPREDRDGDTYFTCDVCDSPFSPRQVPCDCDDDPVTGGGTNAFQPEVCDGGHDNDCNPDTFFADDVDDYRPCVDPLPNAACRLGVRGCDERLGESAGDVCRQATTTQMEPCGIDLGGSSCGVPASCPVAVIDEPQTIVCATEYSVEGCGGSARLVDLIEGLDPAPDFPLPPLTCSAILWGADDPTNGWVVRLQDLNQSGVRAIFDQPCDQISLALAGQAPPGVPYGTVVLVFDTDTGERFALPVAFHSTTSPGCSPTPMTCAPPQ